MGMNPVVEVGQCPRCKAFEFVSDDTDSIEYCLVCGFVSDPEEGDLPLPHYSFQYRMKDGKLVTKDIEEIYGCMPVDNLAETENWLKACESEGIEFVKAVLVNMEGHVIWLRGSPGDWNWACT